MYINIATRAELESLPGLNPKTSLAIVEKRVVRPWTEENIFELTRPGWPSQPFVEIFHFGIPGFYTEGNRNSSEMLSPGKIDMANPFKNHKPSAVKGTTGKRFCTPLSRGLALLQRLEKYHNKPDARRSLDSEVPALGTFGQDQRSLALSSPTAGQEQDHRVQLLGKTGQDRDRMVRSMGGTGQDCDLAQAGLTAELSGTTVRIDRDSMVQSMGGTEQDCDLAQAGLTAELSGTTVRIERDSMVRSMGGTGQDCDLAQASLTAERSGSKARIERDRMVRSMGGVGQDCDQVQPGLTAGRSGSTARMPRVETGQDHLSLAQPSWTAVLERDCSVLPLMEKRHDRWGHAQSCPTAGQEQGANAQLFAEDPNVKFSGSVGRQLWEPAQAVRATRQDLNLMPQPLKYCQIREQGHFGQNVVHCLSVQTTGQVNQARGQVPNRNILQLGQPNQENTDWVSQASRHQSGHDTFVPRNYWENQDPLEDHGQGSNHGFSVGDDFVGIPQSLPSKWKGGLHPQILTDCTFMASSFFLGRWEGRGEESLTQSGLPIRQGQDTNIQPLGIVGQDQWSFAQSGIPTGQRLDTNIQPSGTVGTGSMVSSSVCLFQPDRGGIPMTSYLELAPRSV